MPTKQNHIKITKITKARPLLEQKCKLLNYKDKPRIWHKCNRLKGTSYYINEYFNKETLALCKVLWQDVVKTLQEEGILTLQNYYMERERERERERVSEREMKFRYKINIACLVLIKVNENCSKP